MNTVSLYKEILSQNLYQWILRSVMKTGLPMSVLGSYNVIKHKTCQQYACNNPEINIVWLVDFYFCKKHFGLLARTEHSYLLIYIDKGTWPRYILRYCFISSEVKNCRSRYIFTPYSSPFKIMIIIPFINGYWCIQCFVCFSLFAVDLCLFISLCVCFLLHFFISLKSCPPELFNRVTPQIWHLTFFIFLFDWLFVWNEGGHLYSSTTFHSKSGISLPQRSNSSSWETRNYSKSYHS